MLYGCTIGSCSALDVSSSLLLMSVAASPPCRLCQPESKVASPTGDQPMLASPAFHLASHPSVRLCPSVQGSKVNHLLLNEIERGVVQYDCCKSCRPDLNGRRARYMPLASWKSFQQQQQSNNACSRLHFCKQPVGGLTWHFRPEFGNAILI